MKAPDQKPILDYTHIDNNAYSILNAAVRALEINGADEEYTKKYWELATAGNYNNLLSVTMRYVTFCCGEEMRSEERKHL